MTSWSFRFLLTRPSIPLAVALVVLFYLHRRNVRRQRAEDAKDPLKDMDFGVDHVPIKGGKRKSMFGGEKIVHRPGQLSMDMNLSSPYLLPPGNHSKDSLAQGFPDAHDPYRMVHSETNSIRSFGAGKEGSLYGGSSRHTSVAGRSLAGNRFPPPPRQNSLPRSPATPSSRNDPFATPPPSEPAPSVTKEEGFKDSQFPMQPVVPEIGHIGQAESHDAPQVRSPPAIMPKDPQERTQSPPMSPPPHAKPAEVQDGPIGMAYPGEDFPLPPAQTQQQHAGFNLDLDVPKPLSPPVGIAVQHDDGHDYHDNQPQIRTSEYYDEPQEFDRGMAPQRQASLGYEQPPPQQEGLGVPQQDNKRLSVGFRPLPPAEELESEDPEYRANRIRSFYKEYFDDSKDNAPPVPAMPQYYEDYDESYLGDAAYYDADTNAFVMPYAQPVTRRAMTPPPAGRLRPGGPGPRPGPRPRGPHGPHGSLGGMSLPGGPRGRSRAGSAFGPRPGSSASARMGRPGPKKKLPPPAALSTLPTPSKLKDDSFAILNAIDFAPPDSYQERNRGRSQSPLGERRPYNPQLPVASPLVSAFDEMASLPSP